MTKFAISLLAAAALSLAASGTALAGSASAYDSLSAIYAADGEITKFEAKRLVDKHLRSLGYTRPRFSQMSAQVDRVERLNDEWRIKIRFGGNLPGRSTYLYIDARTGELGANVLAAYSRG